MDRDALALHLLDSMPDALVVSDKDGMIVHWNAGAERIFGFSRGEAVGQSLDIIIPPGLRERHWVGYDETMRTGRTRYGAGDLLAVPALRKDGVRISVQFSIFTVRADGGDIAAIGAIMRDVTAEFEERKAMRKRLAELDRKAAPHA
jgi:PAS domain S-box-containing protein